MYILCFATALCACVIGKICGMGGGVIIKPVLDALGIMSVAAINFLSGCTVLGMSCWSVGKSALSGQSEIDWKVSTPLAIGAAIGGLLGKELFAMVEACFSNANTAGGVQAIILLAATFGTLIYTIYKEKIPMHHVKKWLPCLMIGLALGMMGSFLGIGGGPFNMAVLYFFFAMSTKVAAQNSLYIILISQAAGLLKTIVSGSIPEVAWWVLAGMMVCGILGSDLGGRINKKLSEKNATRLFEASMVLVMLINVFNIVKFFWAV